MSGLNLIEVGCYGKLPVHPEFIVEGNGVSNSGFSQWIADGLAAGRAEWDDAYRERWQGFAPYDLIWSGADGSPTVVGRMRPSSDSGGRRHPFIVFGSVTGSEAASPARVLRTMGGLFHERLGHLLETVAAADGVDDARSRVRDATLTLPTVAPEVFSSYLRETTVGRLFTSTEAGHPLASRYHVLLSMSESTLPFRGRTLDRVPFGLRVPLSTTTTHRFLEVGFWIEIVAGFLNQDLTGTMCLWSEPSVEDGAYLFVFFAPPSGTQFTSLIDPAADIETISYLDRPYGSKPPEERIDPGLRAILESESSTLFDLLTGVKRL